MTTAPATVGSDQTLDQASRLMRERDIRHLPVVDDGKLVGLISERDVAMISNLQGVDPAVETIGNAMTAAVYTVEPDTALDDVVEVMASQKFGSVVVVQNGKVVGVVTTVDVCRALAELLRTRLN